jgi:hypothetical protein
LSRDGNTASRTSLEDNAIYPPPDTGLVEPAGRQSNTGPECSRASRGTMFGNRTATAASILQKTYDESYLTCSTAVYYESQVGTRPPLAAF